MIPAEMRDPETFVVIGAAMAVHSELGCGFLEAVYHEAMQIELSYRSVLFVSQVDIAIQYRQQTLACSYRVDFVRYGSVVVEIKAIKAITPIERAQVINYLKATGFHRALLINFGAESLQYERIVR